MRLFERFKATPNGQKFRYGLLILSCSLFFAPFLLIPSLAGNPDLCGRLCMRRFYLYFPGMNLDDLSTQIAVSAIGVVFFLVILITTFFFGRMWCAYVCPVGGFPELVSRLLPDRWKIEYRALPQVPIRYGYFATYVVLLPIIGISACTLCNFITVPRLFEALSGGVMGIAFLFSAVGLVNLALLFLLGFFASKGRAYCQFLCPIGAIDGLVNRLGARFRFTRRIRVERSRCTGCNLCARKCMCGAIRMVDRVAVVDQTSCMSCHECADVCDWHAISWLAAPPDKEPKRKKKGVEYHPQPKWVAIHREPRAGPAGGKVWPKWPVVLLVSVVLLFITVSELMAAERQGDPDGCLSCHALEGLDYIDGQGLLRSATIDKAHYLGSLHGSVPCRDCHRKVRDYPHKAENTEVDCAESCHVEEPSGGEAYTHEKVVAEFEQSVHGEGGSKGFTGGNRLRESGQPNPSCRWCHSNELYISERDLPRFRESFAHLETDCGSCHRGKAWLNRFGGHILRRFIGSRWSKQDHNRMCNGCHADRERMARVQREDPEQGGKRPAGPRFILAGASYAMTLHGRLLASGVQQGASCIDCHAPAGLRHGVLRQGDTDSSVHPDNLAETCGTGGCHGYAGHPFNTAFLHTDLHDIDMIPVVDEFVPLGAGRLHSGWVKALLALTPVVFVVGGGVLLGMVTNRSGKGSDYPLFGGEAFREKMIGQKPRKPVRGAKKGA